MPGDTGYLKNLILTGDTVTSNGLSTDGTSLYFEGSAVGGGGSGHWTKVDSNIYYDGGNVGIQNTNPIHALTIGSHSNVYANTVRSSIGFCSNIIINSDCSAGHIVIGQQSAAYDYTSSGSNVVSIGNYAGRSAGDFSISVGPLAGFENQQDQCVAVGNRAGRGQQQHRCCCCCCRDHYRRSCRRCQAQEALRVP